MLRTILASALVALALIPTAADARRQHRTTSSPAAGSAPAASQGPTIAFGSIAGASVPILATTSSSPFSGFNVHITATSSAGVTVQGIAGGGAGALFGDSFCLGSRPAPAELIAGCVTLPAATVVGPGTLSTVTILAAGDGCVVVRLVDLEASDPLADFLDTYTIYQAAGQGQMQSNAISTAPARVLVGAGTTGECPS